MDKDKIRAFAGDAAGMAYVGTRMGLIRAMAGKGPMRVAEVAQTSGLQTRYVEEWLKGMTSAGYLNYQPTAQTFELPDEHAYLLFAGLRRERSFYGRPIPFHPGPAHPGWQGRKETSEATTAEVCRNYREQRVHARALKFLPEFAVCASHPDPALSGAAIVSTPVDSVDFYFGLGSRYSYLAFTQLDRIERAHGCRFVLLPLSSVELLDMRGQSPFRQPGLSGQYDWHYRRRDAEAWADYYQVPYVEPKTLPDDHRLLARACWAAHRLTDMRTFCSAILQAVFVDHDNINRAMCIRCAGDLGLDQGAFERALDDGAADELLTQLAHQALRRGVFGVPSFVIGERMFWGNDRLVLLEHYLSRRQNTSR